MPKSRGTERREQIFVVRMWQERDAVGPPQWRAYVTHVVTRERRYFTTYEQLCDFLDRWREQ
jgi:hypothetical protein